MSSSAYPVGTIVRARDRDWIVLPSDHDDLLMLRPLVGSDEESIGVFLPLEGDDVRQSSFPAPSPERPGNVFAALAIADAARLIIRSGAVPFRSLGRLSFVPRPYQFVPLVMALRQRVVRLLIADDVGVGKTIEAALIARELLDRGIIRRLAVLCPAHLCSQWQTELAEKFSIHAEVVQPSTIGRLERNLPRTDVSIFKHYPFLVASIDFLKGDRYRETFVRDAPELIIVDEAHIATRPGERGSSQQQQRYSLLSALARRADRHLVLVTATPHSGIEGSFRSLLGLLDPRFDAELDQPLPYDALHRHFIQRRRADLRQWLGTETRFPQRQSIEKTYLLTERYLGFFDEVWSYCRELLSEQPALGRYQQRMRYWGALSLLRCILSSPRAAVAALEAHRENRLGQLMTQAEDQLVEAVDQSYRPAVFESLEQEEASDYLTVAGGDMGTAQDSALRQRVSRFIDRARRLEGPEADAKLACLADTLRELLRDGFQPIVFCYFIHTANYLKEHLEPLLRGEFEDLQVEAVTGELSEDQRKERIAQLAQAPRRVLVATDCLSEGINLQDHFDAVVHYDLPWNPNRLEQREGRVDRFGQQRDEVRAVTISGENNPVDLTVMRVLVRKARKIREQLGISVPAPAYSERLLESLISQLMFTRLNRRSPGQLPLSLESDDVQSFHQAWDRSAESQRPLFSQETIQPDEIQQQLEAVDSVLGTPKTLERFLQTVTPRFRGYLHPRGRADAFELDPGELRDRLTPLGYSKWPLRVVFDRQRDSTAEYIGRTHPIIETLCREVLGRAMQDDHDFARTSAAYTRLVERRTFLVILRVRYLMRDVVEQYAEEVLPLAIRLQGGRPSPLSPHVVEGRRLLEAFADPENFTRREMPLVERQEHIDELLEGFRAHPDWYREVLEGRREEIIRSNRRLNSLVGGDTELQVEPQEPPDVLAIYALIPGGDA